MTVMPPEAAAWIRDRVLPAGTWDERDRACACQWGAPAWCSQDLGHGRCGRSTRLPVPETYLFGAGGAVARLPEPYAHPAVSATGAHPSDLAMVWLADRTCQWVCPCRCHAQKAPSPHRRPNGPPHDLVPLFDLESA